MKTVKEWLSVISDDEIRESALSNLKKQANDIYRPHREVKTFEDALLWAFIWAETERGAEYWQSVFCGDINLFGNE